MLLSQTYEMSFEEIMSDLDKYKKVIDNDKQDIRRSLEWAKDTYDSVLRASHLNWAGVYYRKAIFRHTYQRELLRMVKQENFFCTAKVGALVHTVNDNWVKAHGVVTAVTPEVVQIYVTHSSMPFFSGMIEVPRERFWSYWDFK